MPCQGEFDLVFCGFWWSHVARADIGRFLAGVAARAEPGARLVLADNRYVPGSNHPGHQDRAWTATRSSCASSGTGASTRC